MSPAPIFVEHGVHFFDLCSFWLGPGRVVTAARSTRPARPGADAGAGPPAMRDDPRAGFSAEPRPDEELGAAT